jgi:hypothetical protein
MRFTSPTGNARIAQARTIGRLVGTFSAFAGTLPDPMEMVRGEGVLPHPQTAAATQQIIAQNLIHAPLPMEYRSFASMLTRLRKTAPICLALGQKVLLHSTNSGASVLPCADTDEA